MFNTDKVIDINRVFDIMENTGEISCLSLDRLNALIVAMLLEGYEMRVEEEIMNILFSITLKGTIDGSKNKVSILIRWSYDFDDKPKLEVFHYWLQCNEQINNGLINLETIEESIDHLIKELAKM